MQQVEKVQQKQASAGTCFKAAVMAAGGASSGRFCTNNILFGTPSFSASSSSTPSSACFLLGPVPSSPSSRPAINVVRSPDRELPTSRKQDSNVLVEARTTLGGRGSLQFFALILGDVGACKRSQISARSITNGAGDERWCGLYHLRAQQGQMCLERK